MTAIDIFCSGDDRHRVILLVDLLERAGQSVTLRCEAVAAPTEPCIVAFTRRAERESWIRELFSAVPSLVAIRLDNTPLPRRCARVIDMQAWPARSADRKVGSLVHWLQHGSEDSNQQGVAPGRGGSGSRGGRARPVRTRVRKTDRQRSVAGGLTVVALLGLAGALLFVVIPDGANEVADPGATDEYAPPTADTMAAVSRNVSLASSQPGSNGFPAGEVGGSLVPARGSGTATATGSSDEHPKLPVEHVRRDDSLEPVPPPARPADALDHLCRARSVEAARAWAGALNWKQRRRLPDAPCVRALIRRPGFEGLRDMLDLS